MANPNLPKKKKKKPSPSTIKSRNKWKLKRTLIGNMSLLLDTPPAEEEYCIPAPDPTTTGILNKIQAIFIYPMYN